MSAYFDQATPEAIEAATRVLATGGVALLPADTVYGFFGRADDPGATERVYDIKKRDRGKPFVLYTNAEQVGRWAEVTPVAARLIDAFWPEALCLVLPKKPTIPDRFTGGLATIAVMTAANPVISGVVSGVDAPLFGTTVNYSGEPSIRFAADAAEFFDRVDVTIGDDSIPVYHKSSTMVDCTVDPPAVIREEAIPAAAVREVVADLTVDFTRRR
jgi:L-threonylcarbamoyladenylate synthase